jgi:AcrR family transcriptional regulator
MEQKSVRVGKEKIMETAEGLFTERGYKAVSIRDIADACQVTNAALYYHFANKEELFDQVLEAHICKLAERMQAAADKGDRTKNKISAILMEYGEITAGHRSPMFLMRHAGYKSQDEESRAQAARMMKMLMNPLEAVLEDAITQGELRSMRGNYSPAAMLVGMLNGLYHHQQQCFGKGFNPDLVEQVVDVFWQGMALQSDLKTEVTEGV